MPTSTMEADEEMLPPGVDSDAAPPGEPMEAEDNAAAKAGAPAALPLSETVVELINQTQLMQSSHRQSTTQRLNNLKKVQEIILEKDPQLLDSFSEEVSSFQHDTSPEIRRFVVAFLEAAALKDTDFIQRTMYNMEVMMQDDNVIVVSRTILACLKLFLHTLDLLCKIKGGVVTEQQRQWWAWNLKLRSEVLPMLESENDGLRSHTIKYFEYMILALSERPKDSDPAPFSTLVQVSSDFIPDNHKILKRSVIEDEGKEAMDTLMEFMARPDISAANLMICLASFTNIAKERPCFTSRIVQGFEALNVNLPPKFTNSQVMSVRKCLKFHLLQLLKSLNAVPYQPNITTLLTDLGATNKEVQSSLPKIDAIKKKKEKTKLDEEDDDSSKPFPKKMKTLDGAVTPGATVLRAAYDDEEDLGMTPYATPMPQPKADKAAQSAIDITAEDLVPKLSTSNVADLVLISMVMLPEEMPSQFQSSYTPIAAAGTHAQIKHLARLLSAQLTAAGLGKGVEEMSSFAQEKANSSNSGKELERSKSISSMSSGNKELLAKNPEFLPPPPPSTLVKGRKTIKVFKLADVTTQLDRGALETVAADALQRLFSAERWARLGGATKLRSKILATLAVEFSGDFSRALLRYIFEDLKNRQDIIFCWIYQAYVAAKGFMALDKQPMSKYDKTLENVLTTLMQRNEGQLFSKVMQEAPVINEGAIELLKGYCVDVDYVQPSLLCLKDLVLSRPCCRDVLFDLLLDLSWYHSPEIRTEALNLITFFYTKARDVFEEKVENYALTHLHYLNLPAPPPSFYKCSSGLLPPDTPTTWSDGNIKRCLYLYLEILPVNHELLHELATVYTNAGDDIKRTILRMLSTPINRIGMNSPELLKLVENCPKRAETLITRIMHILTDKSPPTPELVERVRDIYHKRVSDVRFLIPVLIGLTKKEVISAIPKLIRLNPVVVKEVFNRLLTAPAEGSTASPLTPADLLVALHDVDLDKNDMKTVIKATGFCFAQPQVFTQEVLALVLQQLMERDPIPTLLMRTVIQSLTMYPRLLGFVLNILSRLIGKKVWHNKRVWEGFIRCCQRTEPQSYSILLQLQPPQLKDVFEMAPRLRVSLLNLIMSYNEADRQHLSQELMLVLTTEPEKKEAIPPQVAELAQDIKQEQVHSPNNASNGFD